jgi:serine protease inhibitor
MVLDRPFWLFVQDKRTGAVLFEGRVSDPGTRAGS